jgi:hypothetical protein
VEAILAAMRVHLSMRRPYLPSLGLHVWDFAVYSGLAATGLALACVLTVRPPAISRLALAFGLTLLAVLVSGSAQGEVGRVWLFFMPVVLLLAANTLCQLSSSQRALMVGAQAFWLIVLAASHVPIDTWLGPPPSYAEIARPNLDAPVISANATFGDELLLTGFQGEYWPDRRMLTVALHWRPLRQMTTPYYFSAVPVAPDGRSLPGVHWQPFAEMYPTTCWQPDPSGPDVVDQIDLSLGDAPAQGNWWLSLSVFAIAGDQSLPPLPVRLADGSQDHQLGMGPLPVQGP